MKSSYAENLRNMIYLMLYTSNSNLNPDNKNSWNLSYLDQLKSLIASNELNYMEINGIELSLKGIETTYYSTLNSTLEPANSFFAKSQMVNVDYIFYTGNLEVLRTLNTPDIYQMLEWKSLPNKDFPSDHINMSTDFLIIL